MPATAEPIVPDAHLDHDHAGQAAIEHAIDYGQPVDRGRAPASDATLPPTHQDLMHADDAMAGIVIGGILTLAFSVLVVVMVIVNVWTFNATR